MKEYQKTQGIILHLIPYRDADQIAILFTEDVGLMKIMCYGSRSQKSKWRGLCRSLTQVEIIFREKNSEIFECKDLTLIDSYDNLKQDYNRMEAACDCMYALNRSQMPGREAHKLYALLIYYLRKIPCITDPWILSLSFRLKLLRHDGLLDYPFICQTCEEPLLSAAYCSQGETYCLSHGYQGSLELNESELQLIYSLTASQSYQNLVELILPLNFKAKIFQLFEGCLSGG